MEKGKPLINKDEGKGIILTLYKRSPFHLTY